MVMAIEMSGGLGTRECAQALRRRFRERLDQRASRRVFGERCGLSSPQSGKLPVSRIAKRRGETELSGKGHRLQV